jgi:hypothetical protein
MDLQPRTDSEQVSGRDLGADEVVAVSKNQDAGSNPTPADDVTERPQEFGGPKGPDPVRYGDWERGGRCIDF